MQSLDLYYSADHRSSDNLEKVLRMAVAEHNVPLEAVTLPRQFYDMQYVALDIYEAMRAWAENSEPPRNLHLGSMQMVAAANGGDHG